MEGALSGYAQIQNADTFSTNVINAFGSGLAATAAMVSAVGLSSGKAMFKWVQKASFNLNSLMIDDVLSNGGQIAVRSSRRPRCCHIPDGSDVGVSCARPQPGCLPNVVVDKATYFCNQY